MDTKGRTVQKQRTEVVFVEGAQGRGTKKKAAVKGFPLALTAKNRVVGLDRVIVPTSGKL